MKWLALGITRERNLEYGLSMYASPIRHEPAERVRQSSCFPPQEGSDRNCEPYPGIVQLEDASPSLSPRSRSESHSNLVKSLAHTVSPVGIVLFLRLNKMCFRTRLRCSLRKIQSARGDPKIHPALHSGFSRSFELFLLPH